MKVHLTVAALAVCVGCAAGSGGGEPPGDFRRAPSGSSTAREDRVILTEFNNITGVAVSRRMVFVTSPQGLGIFDRTFERWMPPITGTTGYSSAQVTAIAADPVEDGVWIAVPGSLTYYRAFLDFATSMTVPGIIDVIIFDRRDPHSGAYVRSAGTWLLASRTGSVTQVSQDMLPPPGARDVPSTLRSVYAEFPQLETFAGLLTRDNDLQAWPVSAAAKTPDVSEVWLGTRGNGVYKVDPLFNVAHHFPYGLLADGAGALAPAADGIWIAGSAGPSRTTYGRGGLTFASMDLQRFRWLEGPLRRPLAGARANDLVVRMSSAWIATDRGVARMDTRNEDDFSLWNLTNGLPADQALALAVTSGGAWVGTSRGLVFIADSVGRRAASARAGRGVVSRSMIEGTPVRALLLTGDTLWIGTDAGLMLVQSPSPDSQPRRVAAPSSESRLMRPIRALARSDSVVMVLTQSELVQLNLRSGGVMTRYAALDLGPLRSITAAAVDSTTIWITGLGGLLVISRASGVSRFLTAPGEIPGEAYDVELDPFYAWIATREGVLRLRRLNDGTVR